VLQSWLTTDGYISIAHVRNKTHFVLLTGPFSAVPFHRKPPFQLLSPLSHETGWDDTDPKTLLVNDPGFDQTSYNYDDVADILLYTVLPPDSPLALVRTAQRREAALVECLKALGCV
jgi:hypothetical protein